MQSPGVHVAWRERKVWALHGSGVTGCVRTFGTRVRVHPQLHRVQDAARCLELAGGLWGHGTTRWQQHFASGSGAASRPRQRPSLPAPVPFRCPLPLPAPQPTCQKGGEERERGGCRREGSHLGIAAVWEPVGFDVQKGTEGPSVSSLCLSFPTPASTSHVGSPRPSLLHHTAAHLTGRTRARDLEKPAPGIPGRVSHTPQTLGHPCCSSVSQILSPALSWCPVWPPLRAVRRRLMERLWLATNGLARSWGIASVFAAIWNDTLSQEPPSPSPDLPNALARDFKSPSFSRCLGEKRWAGARGTFRECFFLAPEQEKEMNSQLSSCQCQLSPRIPGNGWV